MAEGVGHHRGGIRSLARLLREHEGAIRRDLLCAGLRLDDGGTETLSWVDLLAFVAYAPPGSAVFGEINPNYLSYTELALRSVEFSSRVATWQNTEDGQKGRNRPEPWPIPGEKKAAADFDPSEYVAMSFDEMDAWLASKREG